MQTSAKQTESLKYPNRWKKGESGNFAGRPPKPEIEELREALAQAKLKHNKDFLVHFVERAYENDNVAIALAKKLLPDRLQGEGFGDTKIVILERKEVNARRKVFT